MAHLPVYCVKKKHVMRSYKMINYKTEKLKTETQITV